MSRRVRVWCDRGVWQLWHCTLAHLYWLKKELSVKQLAKVPLFQHHTLWGLCRSLQEAAQLGLLATRAWVPRVLVHSWLFQELELFYKLLLWVRRHECNALGGLVLLWLCKGGNAMIGVNTILHLYKALLWLVQVPLSQHPKQAVRFTSWAGQETPSFSAHSGVNRRCRILF